MKLTIACPMCIQVQWLVPLVYFRMSKTKKLRCPNCGKWYKIDTEKMVIVEAK